MLSNDNQQEKIEESYSSNKNKKGLVSNLFKYAFIIFFVIGWGFAFIGQTPMDLWKTKTVSSTFEKQEIKRELIKTQDEIIQNNNEVIELGEKIIENNEKIIKNTETIIENNNKIIKQQTSVMEK
ncbi:hypothetical protein CVD28_01300 [Bacillus sp. M6-12]|uniref:hypothetical protein n=1 Tax=Bacillus sp. M6-12 TaxID=2054166 RepID=UPI000C7868BF|nr:hypothetical protein [Bacillus sp. M6-12]PLS19070.1 hypothetical protein CVD28_01300 [Bacillus sp. M6-12]